MPSIDEALRGQASSGGIPGLLDAGIDLLSKQQVITFTKYIRRVLPLDGFVYWVRADLTNGFFGDPTIDIKGSLHYSTVKINDDQGNYGRTTVTFSSEEDALQDSSIDLLIGAFEDLRFAFGTTARYQQAGLWHYSGVAIVPSMASQIIDDLSQLSDAEVVTTNSMALWLAFGTAKPFYGFTCDVPLYPFGLTPYNLKPPYATIMIDNTESMVSNPALDRTMTAYVLAKETVTLKMFGMTNSEASDLRDAVYQWSADYNFVGFMNAPVITDERMPQSELLVMAMCKSMKLEISYVQKDVRNIAQQYIKQAVPTYTISDVVAKVNKGA